MRTATFCTRAARTPPFRCCTTALHQADGVSLFPARHLIEIKYPLLPFTRAKPLQASALLHLGNLLLGFQGHQATDCDNFATPFSLHLGECVTHCDPQDMNGVRYRCMT